MQGIIDIRETDKKRPDRETIPVYVTKKTGFVANEVHDVISSLLESGNIVTKTIKGKESFFLVKDALGSVKDDQILGEEKEGEGNNSFFDFLDNFKTPEKDSDSERLGFKAPGDHSSSPFINIIDKLVNNNSSLHQLLGDERLLNKQLQLKVADLEKELHILKKKCHRPQDPPIIIEEPVNANEHCKKPEPIAESAERKLAEQWNEVKLMKHREYTYLKSIKESAIHNAPKDNTPKTDPNKAKKQNGRQKSKTNNNIIPINRKKGKLNNRDHNSNSKQSNNNTNNNFNDINSYHQGDAERRTTHRKILLLGDSHVHRLDDKKLLQNDIIAKGIGGLRSDQVISRHKQTINSEATSTDEVVIHIGSNDISKNVPQQRIIDNIDSMGKKLKEINPDLRITMSSIFVQTYNTTKNINVVEANQAIKKYCLSKGWDFINHYNISFRHLDNKGMHLTAEGNRLFARNLIAHAKHG